MENRVQGILAAIDSNNWKQALKLIKNAQKKHPDAPILKNLKTQTLLGSGRWEEAYTELRGVQSMELDHRNEIYMKRMAIYLGVGYEIAERDAKIHTEKPDEYAAAYTSFKSWVREGNYEKQQKVAASLMKRHPSDIKYYSWVVMSNFMRAQQPGNEGLLPLCEIMLKRKVDEIKINTKGKLKEGDGGFDDSFDTHKKVIPLYIRVLRYMGKLQEARDVLNSPVGTIIRPPEVNLELQAQIALDMELHSDAHNIYEELLQKYNADNWKYHLGYLHTASDDDTTSSISFLHKLQKDNVYSRGPYLGEIELELQQKKEDSGENLLIKLIINYFKKFQSKPCCFSDLKKYVLSITEEEKQPLANAMLEIITPVGEDESSQSKYYLALSNYYKLTRYMGLYENAKREKIIVHINEMWKIYEQSLALIHNMEDTEYGCGDDLALLSAHFLIELYHRDSLVEDLQMAAMMLEKSHSERKHNHNTKLLLMSVYGMLGAIIPIIRLAKELKIKHIQTDSLSYLVVDDCLHLASPEGATKVCDKVKKFHLSYETQYHDSIILAYEEQNYHKVEDLTNFLERLRRSRQLTVANTETALLMIRDAASEGIEAVVELMLPVTRDYTILRAQHSFKFPNPFLLSTSIEALDKLRENSDMEEVMETWGYPSAEYSLHSRNDRVATTSASWRALTVEEQKNWLSLRGLAAQLIALTVKEIIPPKVVINIPSSGRPSTRGKYGGSMGGRRNRGGRRKGRGKGARPPPQLKETKSVPKKDAEHLPSLITVSFSDKLKEFNSVAKRLLFTETIHDFDRLSIQLWLVLFEVVGLVVEVAQTAKNNKEITDDTIENACVRMAALQKSLDETTEHLLTNSFMSEEENLECRIKSQWIAGLSNYCICTLPWVLIIGNCLCKILPQKKKAKYATILNIIPEITNSAKKYAKEIDTFLTKEMARDQIDINVTGGIEFGSSDEGNKFKKVVEEELYTSMKKTLGTLKAQCIV